jgi:hypothetical protein
MRAFLLLITASLCLASCHFMGARQVRGNGVSSTQQRNVSDFTQVEVAGQLDVVLAQGPSNVRVVTDENLQEYVVVERQGNTLYVHTRSNTNLRPKAGLKVYVTAPDYRGLQVNGSGDVTGQGRITGRDLRIEVTGSGSVALDLDMPRISTQITGSGETRLTGATRVFESEINGSGSVLAYGLLSEETKVNIHGSGDAEVFASKRLGIDIAGSGDVSYKGTASVDQSVHGSGNVHKAD